MPTCFPSTSLHEKIKQKTDLGTIQFLPKVFLRVDLSKALLPVVKQLYLNVSNCSYCIQYTVIEKYPGCGRPRCLHSFLGLVAFMAVTEMWLWV